MKREKWNKYCYAKKEERIQNQTERSPRSENYTKKKMTRTDSRRKLKRNKKAQLTQRERATAVHV